MSFDTPGYVLFLAAAVILHRLCPRRWRWLLLLCASLFFYACWSPPLTLVILGVAALTWACGLGIDRTRSPKARKAWLIAAAAGCVGLLVWFKYFNFLASALAALLGGRWTPLEILLPVGCSFYTFQALSYVIDVYRGLPAARHPGRYALYICFFPQLVAGPIERAGALLPQLTEAPDASREDTVRGLKLLLTGFFRKLVIADLAGPMADRVFAAAAPDGSAVFLGALLFSIQIWCDFAGYSEIARGSALLLGIRLGRNFDRPYLARSIRDFWRRWHRTLGAWFTDYVYIPMGGNRRGMERRIAAVLTVFLLSGLWHGADWTFVCWGLWHGLLYCAELLAEGRKNAPGASRRPGTGRWLLTFLAVTLSWILFRAEDTGHALRLFGALFSPWHPAAGIAALGTGWAGAACLGLGIAQLGLLERLSRNGRANDMTCFFLAACALAAWFLRASAHGQGAFIYFQF